MRTLSSPVIVRSLVLVAILFGALLIPLVPHVEAATTTNTVSIVTGPFFLKPNAPYNEQGNTPFVKARPDISLLQMRTIRFSSHVPVGCSGTGCLDLTKVSFQFQLVDRPGGFDSPDFTKAMRWEASCSSAAGWTPVADNSSVDPGDHGGLRRLDFTANSIKADGTSYDFNVCFRIPNQAVGSSTDPTQDDSYPIKVIADTSNGNFDSTSGPSFRIDIDSIAPVATGAYTKDFNVDGHLDHIQIFFNEAMDPDTLVKDQFVVHASDQSSPYSQFDPIKPTGLGYFATPVTCVAPAIPPCFSYGNNFGPAPAVNDNDYSLFDYQNPAGENTTILTLAPAGRFDTGVRPEVVYPASQDAATNSIAANFTDLAGNKLVPVTKASLIEIDDAKPVLVSTYGITGATKIIATFSENVTTTNNPVSGGTAGALVPADFEWATATAPAPPNLNCQDAAGIYAGIYTDLVNPAARSITTLSGTLAGATTISTTTAKFFSTDLRATLSGPGISSGTYITSVASNGQSVTISTPVVSPGIATTDTLQLQANTQWSGVEHNPNGAAFRANIVLNTPYKLCPDDVGSTFERLHLSKQNTVGVCAPPREYAPCGSKIIDRTGLTAADRASALKVDFPHVIGGGAEVNIGSFQVSLRFNGPVSHAGDNNTGIQLGDIDVVSADGTGQGPAGVIRILHPWGSDLAVLTLDHAVRPTDVDDTPAKIRIRCHNGATGIRGTGLEAFVPCYDPDLDGFADVNLVDLTPPAIASAKTYDGNHDGYIDGYKLTFTEPIDDASFCYNKALLKVANPCDPSNPDSPVRLDSGNVRGPYTWDTDTASNDNEGILRFPDDQAGRTSDTIPVISTTGEGFFTDQSHPQVQSPAYLSAVAMRQVCTKAVATFVCPDVNELDGAPPVIWSARTIDSHQLDVSGPTPVILAEGDGRIDAYRVRFSEAILDNSFHANEWTVVNHPVLSFRTADLGVVASSAGLIDDSELIVTFKPGLGPDTGDKPDLTVNQVLGGLKDRNGVPMLPVLSNTVVEQDDAPPTIYSVDGFANQDKLTIRFSEPVDNGDRGALSRPDFIYSNIASAPGASGLADQNAVANSLGTDSAVLTLNAKLSSLDIGNATVKGDCVSAQINRIFEVAPTVTNKQPIGALCHAIGRARDVTPPADLTDLAEVTPLRTANSVSVTWTAPGNDGLLNGPVAGYLFSVKKTLGTVDPAITPAKGSGEVLASTGSAGKTSPFSIDAGEGITITLDPPVGFLSATGVAQRATFVGLASNTNYYFAVMAFDNATPPNIGSGDWQVVATTHQDSTAPVGQLFISSRTHPVGQPRTSPNATFTWTNMTDPDSTVQYRVAFNEDPGYAVLATDLLVVGNTYEQKGIKAGAHTFHVAAFSAGGESATAHYSIIVGHPAIDPVTIEALNAQINFTATRLNGVNSVDWALPPRDQLPSGSEVEAVRIYRFDDGNLTLVKEIKGTYVSLADGHYDDNSTSATARSAYRVDMVFAEGQAQKSAITGFNRVEDVTPRSYLVPLLVTLLVLVLGGLVVGAVYLRRRNATSFDESGPASLDPDTGVPTHDVKCPSCQTPFQALGVLPLHITCPKCAVSGILQ